MSHSTPKAVFLSHASQDEESAHISLGAMNESNKAVLLSCAGDDALGARGNARSRIGHRRIKPLIQHRAVAFVLCWLGLITLVRAAPPVALKHLAANGADFAYVDAGAGVPVVLVHGALGDYRDWTQQFAALAGRYRVIAYSRRFHYPNQRITEGADYTLAQHADDLVAFLRALHLPPLHLVGHSYGGSVAAIAAAAHPELVRTLTLVEPSLFSLVSSDEEGRALLARQNQAYTQVIARLDRGEGEAVLRDFIDLVAGPGAYEQAPAAAQAEMKENLSTLEPMLRGKNRGAPFTVVDAAKLTMPVLLIGSERSPRIFHLTEDKLEAVLPNARRITLKGVSHFSAREDPAAFNAALLEFLNGTN